MLRTDCKYIHRPMVRPELNKGKPFEAMSLRTEKTWYSPKSKQMMITVLAHEHFIKIVEEDFTHTYAFNDEYKLDEFMSILTYEKAQAVNPPIEVTQAVLKAMEKVPEAKFWVGDDETKYKLERPCNTYVSLNDEWSNGRDFDDGGIPYKSKLQIGDYIQADCPIALQVLLGFTIEGVPKDA